MAKSKRQQKAAARAGAEPDVEHQRRLTAATGAVDTSAATGAPAGAAPRAAKRKAAGEAAEQPRAKAGRPSRLLESLADEADADDDVSDTSEEGEEAAVPVLAKGPFRHKEKVLVLTSRGIPSRFRHLMLDLVQLLPHCKKDSKLDTKSQRAVINEVADVKGCNSVVFFEARKHQDLYIWLAKAPAGPSIKFHCTNVHTMAELKLSGNHLKGSRPVLCFNEAFDEQPHWQLVKEVLTHVFATPRGHPKSKPFVDHVLSFSVADGRVWARNYQVVATPDKKKVTPDSLALVEVGPRFTLNPITVLEGSFAGGVLYSNPAFVSPNLLRAQARRQAAGKYAAKLQTKQRRKKHAAANPAPVSELADVFQ